MNIVWYLLIVVEILAALLLIGVVLIQKTKSQGMGLAFGAGMGESLFGAQVGNVLTKVTVMLAAIFLANTTVLAYLSRNRAEGESVTSKVEASSPVGRVPGDAGPGAGEGVPVSETVAIPEEGLDVSGELTMEADPAMAATPEAVDGADVPADSPAAE